ncbi:MAG: glycosyltransferase family 4 protein [Oligoflexia bacterium]|nr:glycosyltransferase family 4 protein [Oligoflexia bacterium]
MKAETKKILWISPRWPEPANDGAKIATFQLLRYLQNDFEIHLLAILPEEEPSPAISVLDRCTVRVLRRPRPRGSLAFRLLVRPWVPVTFSSFASSSLRNEVKSAVSAMDWDWIVFDGAHAAVPFLKSGAKTSARLVYRAHNAEYSLWERTAEAQGFFKRLALKHQAALVKKIESSILSLCDFVFPVSSDDASLFQALSPAIRSEVIRIGQDFPESLPPRKSSHCLGFVGRLDWLPNRQGLEWFLSKVWAQVAEKRPELTLKVAGSGDASWLERYRQLPRLEILGPVASVDSFYEGIDAAIVPLFFGSGTRVKAIEASRFAVPCISTSLGVEGCPLVAGASFLRAESVEDWVKVLEQASFDSLKALGASAFAVMKPQYDSRVIADKVRRIFA